MTTAVELADDILRRHSSPLKALGELRRELPLSHLLHALQSDSGRFRQLAGESYRHDNGFTKIPLSPPAASGLKLVLHVWQPDNGQHRDNIHDHRWDFASVVLSGQLRFELYEQDPAGTPYSALRYSSPGSQDAYRTSRAGDLRVVPTASMAMAAGSTYLWNMSLLHRAWGAGSRLSATVIVQGPPLREQSLVLLRSELRDGLQPLDRLRPEEVVRQIDALRAPDTDAIWSTT